MSNVLILGGDGYLGWPTAMHFAARGFNVTVADNYYRRKIAEETSATLFFPNLTERARFNQLEHGYSINVKIGDLSDPEFMFQ